MYGVTVVTRIFITPVKSLPTSVSVVELVLTGLVGAAAGVFVVVMLKDQLHSLCWGIAKIDRLKQQQGEDVVPASATFHSEEAQVKNRSWLHKAFPQYHYPEVRDTVVVIFVV